MVIQEFFNNLNIDNSVFKNSFTIQIIHYSSIILLNLLSYAYLLVKFYKVLCYSKMTFEWLPMVNPYSWPFSFFLLVTTPYFSFWSKLFPGIRFEKSSLEVSGIIALEALNSVIYLFVRLSSYVLILLEETESIIAKEINN